MWGRLIAPFREFGFAAGALYAADRLLGRVSPRLGLFAYELMVQPIAREPLLPAHRTKELVFVEIVQGDEDIALMPVRPEIKDSRFKQGARCLGVYRKSKLVGYVWLCFGCYEEDEVRCTYELAAPERSVFDFDLYVLPEHRMGTAFMAVWHAANEFLRERGVQFTFSRMTRFNLASRRSHARLGARRIARAWFLRAWTAELALATVSPYVALTWAPSRRVRLRLAPPAALEVPQSMPEAGVSDAQQFRG
jgi:hypothetical protein